MSTPSALSANGRARKSLEHQLDRFATALAAAHGFVPPAPTPTPQPPAPRGPTLRERIAARWRRLRNGIATIKGRVVGAVAEKLRTTRAVLAIARGVALADRRG